MDIGGGRCNSSISEDQGLVSSTRHAPNGKRGDLPGGGDGSETEAQTALLVYATVSTTLRKSLTSNDATQRNELANKIRIRDEEFNRASGTRRRCVIIADEPSA